MNDAVLILLAVALGVGLMLLAAVRVKHRPSHAIDKEFVSSKWNDIQSMAAKADHSSRFAVVEADKLLDYALKQRGYNGETMGARMRAAGGDFSSTDDVWSAHKLRNKLVHESHYEVDRRLIKRAISQFERALKDMGAL